MKTFILAMASVFALVLAPACREEADHVLWRSLREPAPHGNVLPDFSLVGYRGGGMPIPDVPVVAELSPQTEGDDRERIQDALDAIGRLEPDENGFRGALLLRAGHYRVYGYLHIGRNGVVLRGEGQGPEGTVITATRRDYIIAEDRRRQHSLIYLGKLDLSRTGFLGKAHETRATGMVPVGSHEIEVLDAGGFAPGEGIIIEIYPNQQWLEALSLEEQWASMGRGTRTRFYYEREITAIDGKVLHLDAPLTFYLDEDHFHRVEVWSYDTDQRVRNSGVEHLRLLSYFNTENYLAPENFSRAEKHARNAVRIEAARDVWVRNITSLYFPHAAVKVQAGARNITIQDSACLDPVSQLAGGRRYPFRVDGTRVLVQRCYARRARHAFTSSSVAPGPNVFLDCLAERSYGPSGPHIKWATGFLYDNIADPDNSIEVRKARPRSGHGWRGVNHVLWNCTAAFIVCDDPETRDTNWSVGSLAPRRPSPNWTLEPGRWIAHGRTVAPRSLYLAQLEARKGAEAVRAVTTELQRTGEAPRIWDELRERLAELTPQEHAQNNNQLKDPDFRIAGRRSPWTVQAAEELDLSDLERAVNPRTGETTALVLPAGVEVQQGYFILALRELAVQPVTFELSLDISAPGDFAPSVIIDQSAIPYRGSPGSEGHWLSGDQFSGPLQWTEHPLEDHAWRRGHFQFTMTPPGDGDGLVFTPLLRVRLLAANDAYSIANPFLRQISTPLPPRGP